LIMNTFDERPLPLGGNRIPLGMEAHVDWKSLPEQISSPISSLDSASLYGADYAEAEQKRIQLGELKKSISSLMPSVAAIGANTFLLNKLNNSSSSSSSSSSTTILSLDNQLKLDNILSLNNNEISKIQEGIDGLQKFYHTFPKETQFGLVISHIISECSRANVLSKEDIVELNDFVTAQTRIIFREQTKLLETMKQIKKQKTMKN